MQPSLSCRQLPPRPTKTGTFVPPARSIPTAHSRTWFRPKGPCALHGIRGPAGRPAPGIPTAHPAPRYTAASSRLSNDARSPLPMTLSPWCLADEFRLENFEEKSGLTRLCVRKGSPGLRVGDKSDGPGLRIKAPWTLCGACRGDSKARCTRPTLSRGDRRTARRLTIQPDCGTGEG